ncbi:MAG TPA: hypothetical protein VF611_20595 [Pyrinomonadaceae bacterium]|jgi:hypothetical protein
MKRLILSLAVISLAGAGAAAQTVTKTRATAAAAAGSPAAVVRELYRIHRNGYGPLFEKRGRKQHEKFFDAKLAGLIWKDLTETPKDEVGRLDFDPLYNAQDIRIKNFRVGAAAVEGDAASVPVTFVNFDREVKLDFRLVRTKAGWKISNIVYGGEGVGSDLLKLLGGAM